MQAKVTYERNINKSFMKIAAVKTESLDEKLMLHKEYRGILSAEKCYVNGEAEYWYNITGKQALDNYCKMNTIGQEFFEMLILRICSQLEILDWNLIDTRCLVLNPEQIFLDHDAAEISFVLYPDSCVDLFEELQNLLEFLLTKINHEDREGVKGIYRIYELILSKAFCLSDLKQTILRKEEKEVAIETEVVYEEPNREEVQELEPWQQVEKIVVDWIKRIQEFLGIKHEHKEKMPMVFYPEDEEEEREQLVVNPTICLTAMSQEPLGNLLYEGMENYPDFHLEKEDGVLGKNPNVRFCLNKETISQFHAKFEYSKEKYYIEDLNSTNGTFVNDELLAYKEKKELSSGDVIRFADVKYRFL